MLSWTEDLRVDHIAFSEVMNQTDSLCHLSLVSLELGSQALEQSALLCLLALLLTSKSSSALSIQVRIRSSGHY